MEFLNQYWGINENISPLETFLRAIVMFAIAVVLVRLSGMRPFGKGDSFDMVIVFLIGAILSRGVVGATPFFSTVAGAIGIVLFHVILSKLSFYNKFLEKKIKGKSVLLFRDGKFLNENMKEVNITEKDIMEELRLNVQMNDLEKIKEVFIERTGEISFVEK